MKLGHILYQLYCEPWCILPKFHQQICEVVDNKMAGIKSSLFDFLDKDEDDEDDSVIDVKDGIATIHINGVISHRIGKLEKTCGACDTAEIMQAVKSAMNNDEVSGIMLDMNSPGGGVKGVMELADIIGRARDKKPVMAYTDSLCCSAAYWIASQSSMIMASPSSSVGSVGVYMYLLDDSRAYEMAGYKAELFSTGKLKAMGISGLPLTEVQRASLQESVEKVFSWFTGSVTKNRTITDDVKDGGVFFGEEAKGKGLIELTGSYEDAMNELKEMIRTNKR